MIEFACTLQAAQDKATKIIDTRVKDALAGLQGTAAEKGRTDDPV